MDKNWRPDVLCFSSGGVKGYAQLGSLHYLDKKNMLNNVTKYIGTSVGSLILFLYCIGYSSSDILKEALLLDVSKYIDIDISKMRIADRSKLFKTVRDMTIKKMGFYPSFEQLYKLHDKEFVCVGSNIDRQNPVYFSYNTHPKMSCLRAIEISCTVPYIFEQVMYKRESYVDGALCDPFPIHYFDNGINKILGICTISDAKHISGHRFLVYPKKMLALSIKSMKENILRMASNNCITIKINIEDYNIIENSKHSMENLFFYKKGIDKIKELLDEHNI
jgi:predicted acylesterase/phospholipase RssA